MWSVEVEEEAWEIAYEYVGVIEQSTVGAKCGERYVAYRIAAIFRHIAFGNFSEYNSVGQCLLTVPYVHA